MRWFDDLWLKEGFATYMAAKMQDLEGLPNPWMSFYLRNKPAAYDVDQTSGTTPVWQQLANLDQAKSNYGAIVYNKAPGILKQLNYLVGDSAFRAGLHDFLIAHAYGNATWQDLLASIGKAAHRPLAEWGRQYILRPGLPVTEQVLETENGTIKRLALIQHPAQSLSGRGIWPMRTEVVLWSAGAAPAAIPVEVTAETTVVAAAKGRRAPDFVFANANDEAYGLVMLDPQSSRWLLAHLGEVRDPFLRAMLWGAQMGSRARRAPRAGGVHRLSDPRAAERIRRTDRGGSARPSEPRDVGLPVGRATRAPGAGRRGHAPRRSRRTQSAPTAFARIFSTRTFPWRRLRARWRGFARGWTARRSPALRCDSRRAGRSSRISSSGVRPTATCSSPRKRGATQR